jgi:hypothetical protein
MPQDVPGHVLVVLLDAHGDDNAPAIINNPRI